MNKKSIFVSIILIALILLAGCATNPLKKECILNGMIYGGDNEPLTDADIYIDNNKICSSDVYGHFSIVGLKIGQNYTLTAKKKGYEDTFINFDYANSSQMVYLSTYSVKELLNETENALKQSNYALTRSYLERIENIEKDNYSALYLEAILLYKEKKYDDSIAILEKLLSKKNVSYVYLLLADNYEYGLKDIEKAKECLKHFLTFEYNQEIEQRFQNLNETETKASEKVPSETIAESVEEPVAETVAEPVANVE